MASNGTYIERYSGKFPERNPPNTPQIIQTLISIMPGHSTYIGKIGFLCKVKCHTWPSLKMRTNKGKNLVWRIFLHNNKVRVCARFLFGQGRPGNPSSRMLQICNQAMRRALAFLSGICLGRMIFSTHHSQHCQCCFSICFMYV